MPPFYSFEQAWLRFYKDLHKQASFDLNLGLNINNHFHFLSTTCIEPFFANKREKN